MPDSLIHIVPDEPRSVRIIALCGATGPELLFDNQPALTSCPACKAKAAEIGYRPRLDREAKQILGLLNPYRLPRPNHRGRLVATALRLRER